MSTAVLRRKSTSIDDMGVNELQHVSLQQNNT
jgi:hypothetical protein